MSHETPSERLDDYLEHADEVLREVEATVIRSTLREVLEHLGDDAPAPDEEVLPGLLPSGALVFTIAGAYYTLRGGSAWRTRPHVGGVEVVEYRDGYRRRSAGVDERRLEHLEPPADPSAN